MWLDNASRCALCAVANSCRFTKARPSILVRYQAILLFLDLDIHHFSTRTFRRGVLRTGTPYNALMLCVTCSLPATRHISLTEWAIWIAPPGAKPTKIAELWGGTGFLRVHRADMYATYLPSAALGQTRIPQPMREGVGNTEIQDGIVVDSMRPTSRILTLIIVLESVLGPPEDSV